MLINSKINQGKSTGICTYRLPGNILCFPIFVIKLEIHSHRNTQYYRKFPSSAAGSLSYCDLYNVDEKGVL